MKKQLIAASIAVILALPFSSQAFANKNQNNIVEVTPVNEVSVSRSFSDEQKRTAKKASYYAHYFHGRKTANGERFDMHAMTAAHRCLPFNTLVEITNMHNGKSVVVRINDWGPVKRLGREYDLSMGAMEKIGGISKGVIPVEARILSYGSGKHRCRA